MSDEPPPGPCFQTRRGALYRSDALAWMASLDPGRCRLMIADPPYNVRRERWDRLGPPAAYLDWTRSWVKEAHRLLTSDGTLYICGLPETLAEIAVAVGPMFASSRSLVWCYRNK